MCIRDSFTTRLSIAVINDRSGDTSSMGPLEADLRQVLGCGKKDIIEINTGLMATYGDNVTEFGTPPWRKSAPWSPAGAWTWS